MDNESIFLLQCLDCNCNDCGYMVRDFEAYKESEALAIKINPNVPKNNIANYGFCEKLKKSVKFYIGILSIENQKCFLHRKILTQITKK